MLQFKRIYVRRYSDSGQVVAYAEHGRIAILRRHASTTRCFPPLAVKACDSNVKRGEVQGFAP